MMVMSSAATVTPEAENVADSAVERTLNEDSETAVPVGKAIK